MANVVDIISGWGWEVKIKIALSTQEVEFALACIDFVAEKDVAVGRKIRVIAEELVIPRDIRIAEYFVCIGVSRLTKVLHLAIENKAISLEEAPRVIANLAAFNEKIMLNLIYPATNPDIGLH